MTDFEIEICSRKTGAQMHSTHIHDSYELYYLASGEISYFIEDNVYKVKKGDMIFISPKSLHKTQITKNPEHKRILIYFTKEFINEFLAYNKRLLDFFTTRQLSIPKQKQEINEQILYSMSNEYENKTDIIMIKSLLGELLVTSNISCVNSFVTK